MIKRITWKEKQLLYMNVASGSMYYDLANYILTGKLEIE